VLPHFKERRAGHLSLISSIAGYRGLPQALSYGPTKAALSHLAEILYLDLRGLGIGVSAIHPGFVDTPLTQKNRFPMPFIITSTKAAEHILAGWEKGHYDIHFPKQFTLIVKALSLLPAALYLPLIKKITRL
jgi:short-subunit dehydrogenase